MAIRTYGVFRSLRIHNYRLWIIGALVSNIGTWMQRIGQDWLVLTELTDYSASAVGVTVGLQFAPQLLFLPLTGFAADCFDQRKLMLVTQTCMGVLALGLGALTVSGVVELWHVNVFAFLFGCAAAFDAPARQTFVGELVKEQDLANAVALNSTAFNAARMIGPALSGIVIAAFGLGWAFLINGASFFAVIYALLLVRTHELHRNERTDLKGGGFLGGVKYVLSRADLTVIMVMMFFIGTFGLNFSITISAMVVSVFRSDANGYGILTSMMAIGTIAGAFVAAGRERPGVRHLVTGSFAFAIGCILAAIAPGFWTFGAALVLTGAASLTLLSSSNAVLQLTTQPAMRGRVMAIRMAIALGGTPIGAPIVGWVADHAGPRWAVAIGALAGFCAGGVGLAYLAKAKGAR